MKLSINTQIFSRRREYQTREFEDEKEKRKRETVKRAVVIEEGQSEDKTIVRSRANAFVSKCNVTLRSE